jgi:hypothetical protein
MNISKLFICKNTLQNSWRFVLLSVAILIRIKVAAEDSLCTELRNLALWRTIN